MYELLIRDFINNMDEYTIKKFALKQGVELTEEETRTILIYLKNYWQVLYKGDPQEIFDEFKEKVRPIVYEKAMSLYQEAKKKINN